MTIADLVVEAEAVEEGHGAQRMAPPRYGPHMAAPLRIAIAGTGFIGAVHARSARLAGARLVGVSASSPERSEAAARALGAEQAFATAEALVESPDVDVVHICTPNHLHLPLAEAALAAGKHVICEKPLAIDLDGARRLVDAAAAAGSGRRGARSSIATTRRSARRASESAAARPVRSGSSTARTCRTGCCARGRQLARGCRARRRVARRSPTSARTGATSPSSSPATASPASSARTLTALPQRRRAQVAGVRPRRQRGRAARRRDRGRCRRAVRDGRRRRRQHHRQPDLTGPEEPPVDRGRRRSRGAGILAGGARDAVDRPTRRRHAHTA